MILKTIFFVCCSAIGAANIYEGFVMAPAQLWQPTELAYAGMWFVPVLLGGIVAMLSKVDATRLPWGFLLALIFATGIAEMQPRDVPRVLLWVATLPLCWIVLLKTLFVIVVPAKSVATPPAEASYADTSPT